MGCLYDFSRTLVIRTAGCKVHQVHTHKTCVWLWWTLCPAVLSRVYLEKYIGTLLDGSSFFNLASEAGKYNYSKGAGAGIHEERVYGPINGGACVWVIGNKKASMIGIMEGLGKVVICV